MEREKDDVGIRTVEYPSGHFDFGGKLDYSQQRPIESPPADDELGRLAQKYEDLHASAQDGGGS